MAVDCRRCCAGAKITGSTISPGLAVADTFVQDVAFVLAAIYCAKLGGRVARSWQFGLRRPGEGWWWASRLIIALIIVFLALQRGCGRKSSTPKRRNCSSSSAPTKAPRCSSSAPRSRVWSRPICEEFLFRGYIFTALRNWRGTFPAALITAVLFGGVHVGSAPVLDLVPLAALGFGLCLLYRFTGSLYPPIIAHSINNSIAFSSLEDWGWQLPVLMAGALLTIWVLAIAFRRIGIIEPSVRLARLGA